jgi:hypothetical protein
MQSIRRNSQIAVVLQFAVVLVIGTVILNRAVAQPTDLYDFTGGPADSRAGSVTALTAGSDGNIYGTTQCSGNAVTDSCPGAFGAIFALRHPEAVGGAWTFKVLHGFSQDVTQGNDPISNPLAVGPDGTLYGTTFDGSQSPQGPTQSLVWSLSPPGVGGGTWSYQVLHYFDAGVDGTLTQTGVVIDSAGTLYGQTDMGAHPGKSGGGGSVYALAPPASGGTTWSETVLHTFPSSYVSVNVPPVVSKDRQQVYGVVKMVQTDTYVVFQLHHAGSTWKYSPIYTVPAGLTYFSNLVINTKRNLFFYVLSEQFGVGSVYQLSPPAAGTKEWSVNTLYEFTMAGGYTPNGDLAMDASGALVGAALNYSDAPDAVFRLAPGTAPGSVPWTFTVIGTLAEGSSPMGVFPGPEHTQIGVTEFGGLYGAGLLFQQ